MKTLLTTISLCKFRFYLASNNRLARQQDNSPKLDTNPNSDSPKAERSVISYIDLKRVNTTSETFVFLFIAVLIQLIASSRWRNLKLLFNKHKKLSRKRKKTIIMQRVFRFHSLLARWCLVIDWMNWMNEDLTGRGWIGHWWEFWEWTVLSPENLVTWLDKPTLLQLNLRLINSLKSSGFKCNNFYSSYTFSHTSLREYLRYDIKKYFLLLSFL